MRWAMRLLGAAVLVVLVYVVVTGVQVLAAALDDDAGAADAIVVLGAAQYNGRPSPALQARLDRAIELYEAGHAPVIWVTGGRQPGDEPQSSEASTSSQYLIRRGVPNDAIRIENQGASTYESVSAAAFYLRADNRQEVLFVSDRWHGYRVAAIARNFGLQPRFAPAQGRLLSSHALERFTTETLAVSAGRLVGYRRLTQLAS